MTNAEIIGKALSATTVDEALEVAKLIEASVGHRYARPIGDRFNNFGLMASSGSYEYKALEPVTNGQDAVLERYAAAKYGSTKGVAFGSPTEAAAELLSGLKYTEQGDLVSVTFRESDAPTRSTKRLTVVYRDLGCGMEPAAIPKTIFALGSSHKTENRWLQGAFGIGGASTYRNAKAVVLVTRRASEMNPLDDRIAVAVVLWEAQGKGQSAYYLTKTDFESDPDAEPWSAPASDFPAFDAGTHLALISYGVEGFHASRSGDEKSFDMVLNTRLFVPILPVKFNNEIVRDKNEYLRGLMRRFDDNPSSMRLTDDDEMLFSVGGNNYRLPVRYWVFPTGDSGSRRRFVARSHALVFISNGQVHHHWTPTDFKVKTSLNKLYERIFVVVDTDRLPIEVRTALFTPDRSQMLANEPALQLEDQVASFIDSWPQLRSINDQLVREAVAAASGGRSTIDIGRKIASAFKLKGFSIGGGKGEGGGQPGGPGGPRLRKRVETYANPTAFEGPDRLILEDGRTRYIEYMLNAKDDFLDSGRGHLTFETNHPEISPNQHIATGRLRDGYVRVQIRVPEGAAEGTFSLTARLEDWHKAGGGIGAPFVFTTVLDVVDELPARTGVGSGPGKKGASEGDLIAVVWTTPEKYGAGWSNAVPGSVDWLPAEDLAANENYKDLASLGVTKIPTVSLNEEHSPFKAYIALRAKKMRDGGTSSADRYAEGLGLGLMVMDEEFRKAAEGGGSPDESIVLTAKQAIARSVLFMMPSFDIWMKEAGMEE